MQHTARRLIAVAAIAVMTIVASGATGTHHVAGGTTPGPAPLTIVRGS